MLETALAIDDIISAIPLPIEVIISDTALPKAVIISPTASKISTLKSPNAIIILPKLVPKLSIISLEALPRAVTTSPNELITLTEKSPKASIILVPFLITLSNKETILFAKLPMLVVRLSIALKILRNQLRTLSSQLVSEFSSLAPSPAVFPSFVVLPELLPCSPEALEKPNYHLYRKYLNYHNSKQYTYYYYH